MRVPKPYLLLLFVVGISAALCATIVLPHGQVASGPAKKAPLVSVIDARSMDIPIDLTAQGHIVPLNFVDIRPQLSAIVLTVHFREGEDVKAGQLLFTLDDRDARAQLLKAEAQGALIAAQLADARRELQRAQALVASKFVALSAADAAAGKVDALLAQARAAAADALGARTMLAHARIVAPITGRAGAVALHPGSLAQTGATAPLVTIAQFSPVGVEFSLPEQNLPVLLAAREAGTVHISLDGSAEDDGRLVFINNTINRDSATINVKASFPNRRQTMWPGGFARIVVHAGVSRAAVVLPPQAVQEGPGGRFVFLMGADSTVAARPVTLLRVQDGRAVVAGLSGGEKVVLEGGPNLRTGMRVELAQAGAARKVAP